MRIWNKSVNDRLRDLSTASAKPRTVHIHIDGDKRLVCGKTKTGEVVEELSLPSQLRHDNWRTNHYSWDRYGQNVSGSWLLRIKYVHGKDGVRVTICRLCQSATESRLAQDAMEVLARGRGRGVAVQPNHGATPDPFKDKGGVLGLLPPPRPVGTEYMTGHLDEGSAAGGCAAAGAGYRTAYLPWVTCAACLVFFDESMESELLKLRGLYVEAVK